MSRALVIASYLILLIGGYFAVGIVVADEKERASAIEQAACRDLRGVVHELNDRVEPFDEVRFAALHAVKTAARTARTKEAAKRYRESADSLRDVQYKAVPFPVCGGIR